MVLTGWLLVMAVRLNPAGSGRGGVSVAAFIALAVLLVIVAGCFLLRKRK
jgi:hypothetical protein